jgi:nitronate monooxygenase
MATVESEIHQNVKDRLVQAGEQDTQLIFRQLRNTHRVADNAVSREVVAKLNAGGTFEDIRHLVTGVRGREVFQTGDIDHGVWSAGIVQGLIRDIPTCAELVSRIVAEATEIIQDQLASAVTQEQHAYR